jgi:hypothetical protein
MFGSWFAVLGALMADAAPNPVPAETDRADLDRALQGDGDAFARIVARHQQRVAAHVDGERRVRPDDFLHFFHPVP